MKAQWMILGFGMTIASYAQMMNMTTPFATAMKDSMVRMSAGMHSAPVNGNPDHDFATVMIPHHQGGIDMAKAELQYGKDPAMRKVAQDLINDQQGQINQLQVWIKKAPKAAKQVK